VLLLAGHDAEHSSYTMPVRLYHTSAIGTFVNHSDGRFVDKGRGGGRPARRGPYPVLP
jgi:hypothetical protein